jgi:hypothetical protein
VLIITLNILESEDRSGLLVDHCDSAETGFALDDHIGDTHLAAKSGGEEDDQLSMGSTSWAMTTRDAFFASMRATQS